MAQHGLSVGAERNWHKTKFCDRKPADLKKLYMWDTEDTYFSYNAHALHSFGWWKPLCTCVMSRIFSKELHWQGFLFTILAAVLGYVLCHIGAIHQPNCPVTDWDCNEKGAIHNVLMLFESDIANLARYVGSLFISLTLSRTYYSNRGLLGSVFAQTLGLAMAVSSWIKPRGSSLSQEDLENGLTCEDVAPHNFKDFTPQELHDHLLKLGCMSENTIDALLKNNIGGSCFFHIKESNVHRFNLNDFGEECSLCDYVQKMKSYYEWGISGPEVIDMRREIIRYSNAGFRMLWLEHIGDDQLVDVDGNDYEILHGLLTPEEWKHIDGIPSRVTYIYSWICDLIWESREKGFIRSDIEVVRLHEFVEILRGANVWGLPSLPFPYVYWITVLVKSTILLTTFVAARNIGHLLWEMDKAGRTTERIIAIFICLVNVMFVNFVWQGLLDLHSMLRNPNQGLLAGHMPTEIFLTFTRKVTENINHLLPRAPINNLGKSTRFDEDHLNSLARAEVLVGLVDEVTVNSGADLNSFAGNIAFMETARHLGFSQKDIHMALFKIHARKEDTIHVEEEEDGTGGAPVSTEEAAVELELPNLKKRDPKEKMT